MSPKETCISTNRGGELLNILKSSDLLSISNLTIHRGTPFQEGEFFVGLPRDLADVLPGSVLGPEAFLKEIEGESNYETALRLLGQEIGTEENVIYSNKTSNNFHLRVLRGSTNPYALEISKLAAIPNGFDDPQVRATYQREVFEVMTPILDRPSGAHLTIVEDCLASGDTIVGVLTLLSKMSGLDFENKKIRIDVAVATTQGILVLKKFAEQNNLQLEINVGYLAYGLSEGEEENGVRLHANYITYPKEVFNQLPEEVIQRLQGHRAADGNIYVVGDMGDASKRTSDCPWDELRTDSWGLPEIEETGGVPQKFNSQKPTVLYFANGGYLIQALLKYTLKQKRIKPDLNEIVFSAKRKWDEQHGYGVLVYDLPPEILV